MNDYVYLNFPDVKDFAEYLRVHGIHRYGTVVRTKSHKHNVVRYYFRLTAKDETNRVIAVCDVKIWEGYSFDLKPEKFKPRKDKVLSQVREAFKGEFQFTETDAEYQLTLE